MDIQEFLKAEGYVANIADSYFYHLKTRSKIAFAHVFGSKESYYEALVESGWIVEPPNPIKQFDGLINDVKFLWNDETKAYCDFKFYSSVDGSSACSFFHGHIPVA